MNFSLYNIMTVIIPKKAYLTIVAAAVRFANARIPKDDWLEASGVLIGKNVGDDVVISAAHPIMHQELDKNAVMDQYKWKDEDYEALSIIDDEAFSRGEFTVGWYHSHPGFKVMMSHIDIRTTLSYQTNNPLAISLVFNHMRLIKQIELPDKKGDPDIPLENDPGFKIFRLDDVSGIEASYHPTDYKIEGYESMTQLIQTTQAFIIDVTNLLPKEGLIETYQNQVNKSIEELNSQLIGTEEYLKTLAREGATSRIPEVLLNQTRDINKFVERANKKIEKMKEFLDYLEYKERNIIIHQALEVINLWKQKVENLETDLRAISQKF